VLGFNLLGDGIRDLLDPRTRLLFGSGKSGVDAASIVSHGTAGRRPVR